MKVADRQGITEVAQAPEGDARFPETVAVAPEKTAKMEGNEFAFVTLSRRQSDPPPEQTQACGSSGQFLM